MSELQHVSYSRRLPAFAASLLMKGFDLNLGTNKSYRRLAAVRDFVRIGIDRMGARKLLRDIRTKEWLKAGGTFTTRVQEALEIESFSQANEFCRLFRGKRRLEMVIKFQDEKDDVYLPME